MEMAHGSTAPEPSETPRRGATPWPGAWRSQRWRCMVICDVDRLTDRNDNDTSMGTHVSFHARAGLGGTVDNATMASISNGSWKEEDSLNSCGLGMCLVRQINARPHAWWSAEKGNSLICLLSMAWGEGTMFHFTLNTVVRTNNG